MSDDAAYDTHQAQVHWTILPMDGPSSPTVDDLALSDGSVTFASLLRAPDQVIVADTADPEQDANLTPDPVAPGRSWWRQYWGATTDEV